MLGGDPSRDSPFISTGLVSGRVADSTLGTGQEWGQCGPRGCGAPGQSRLLPFRPPGQGRLWEEAPGVRVSSGHGASASTLPPPS